MTLVRSGEAQYGEYEALLLERDQVRKQAGQYQTAYLDLFGPLMLRIYEEKLECVKRKKAIAYCQQAINRGGRVESADLQAYLDREMAEFRRRLQALMKDVETARSAGTSTAYEVKRAKTLYRRLAKKLHPDLHPRTEQHEALKALWMRVVTAYGHNDVKALTELEVLAERMLQELGIGGDRVEVPDLAERIAELREEIDTIRRTEPYTYGALVDSEEAVRNKLIALEDELESCRKYRADLDGVLQAMLDGGGITVQ